MATYEVQLTAQTTVTRRLEIEASSFALARSSAIAEAIRENADGVEYEWQIAGNSESTTAKLEPAGLSQISTDEVDFLGDVQCEAGIHSWVDGPTVRDGKCARCNEPYGDPL